MYRLFLGKISTLSQIALPSALAALAPVGPRRNTWLAGRVMLHHAVSPLPEIRYGERGKPEFDQQHSLWFNLSHSKDSIALLLSDEGPVGCDIEVFRPRPNWQQVANTVFTTHEHAVIEQIDADARLAAFWRIWTRKEAMVKQQGGSVWQVVGVDSTAPLNRYLSDIQHEGLSLAICTPTPFDLRPELIEHLTPETWKKS